MDYSQDLLEFDSEVKMINIPRESDPFLPVLPSPDIPEEPLEDGFNTLPVTPLQSPHAFVKGGEVAIFTATYTACDTHTF